MKRLADGDVVITPAVDRLSRDTTDLLVIAREMQRAGAGIRSLAEPYLDTTSDFAEIVFAILGVAAKLERRRILERTARGRPTPRPRASDSAASRSSPRTSSKRPASASKRAKRSAASLAATMSVKARFPA
jgi:DNA invertase Pin-like site-specific DNA recombinase